MIKIKKQVTQATIILCHFKMYTYFSSLSTLVCLKPGNKMLQKREPGESLKPKKHFIQDAHETQKFGINITSIKAS